jgi:hypothetical protein
MDKHDLYYYDSMIHHLAVEINQELDHLHENFWISMMAIS